MTPQLEQALDALESAKTFIKNGVALGFIRMPDKDVHDPAHNALPKIEAAIQSLKSTPAPDFKKALEAFPEDATGDFFFKAGQYCAYLKSHGDAIRTALSQSIKSGEDKTVSRSRVLSEFNDWDCVEYNTILNALETIEKCGWKITKE